jgi:hypothetical protein
MAEQDFSTEELAGEQWRPCPGFPEYAVSSLGRVRRETRAKGARPGRALSSHDRGGYRCVGLCHGAKQVTRLVHRLVAFAFLGDPPRGAQVNHKNGIKADNRAENLEWSSREENMKHAVQAGLMATGTRHGSRTKPESRVRGEGHASAKLTDADVRDIRARCEAGEHHGDIARDKRISPQTVSGIKYRRTWKHVE